jgi:hypothetical protein
VTGEFYSNAPAAKDRAAWRVVHRSAPHKGEKQCREIISTWIKRGLLKDQDYQSPSRDGREVSGLVENSKRPGRWVG